MMRMTANLVALSSLLAITAWSPPSHAACRIGSSRGCALPDFPQCPATQTCDGDSPKTSIWGPCDFVDPVCPDRPRNDSFTFATALSGLPTSVNGTTALATREPGEPDHYTDPTFSDNTWWLGDHTVWYTWSSPFSGPSTVTVDVCTASIDSILSVYAGAVLTSLTKIVDNNNNHCATGWGSLVTFTALPGTPYHFVVGDAGGGRENVFTLKVY